MNIAGEQNNEGPDRGIIATAHNAMTLMSMGNSESDGLSIPMPFQTDVVLLDDTVVAGTTHVAGIDEIVTNLTPGQKLRFERDPSNSHDKWAIRVFAAEHRMGFVSAETNEIIARLMDGGKHVYGVVVEHEKLGDWNKIHMEVHLDD